MADSAMCPTDQLVRVLIVDDHELFVQSLARVFEAEATIDLVGTAASLAEAIEKAEACAPDVVLLDFELPDGDGPEGMAAIRSAAPDVAILMLSARTDQQALDLATSAGCAGYVAKTCRIDELVAAIHAAGTLGADDRPVDRGACSLGRREVEILGLMSKGLGNKAVARELHRNINTVRNHVQSILAKTGAHSKLEAVATAVREGIITRDRAAAVPR